MRKIEEKHVNEDEHGNETGSDGTGVEDKKDDAREIKLLLTKQKETTEEEDDQDIVIEMLRNAQDIIEYWIQNR